MIARKGKIVTIIAAIAVLLYSEMGAAVLMGQTSRLRIINESLLMLKSRVEQLREKGRYRMLSSTSKYVFTLSISLAEVPPGIS